MQIPGAVPQDSARVDSASRGSLATREPCALHGIHLRICLHPLSAGRSPAASGRLSSTPHTQRAFAPAPFWSPMSSWPLPALSTVLQLQAQLE